MDVLEKIKDIVKNRDHNELHFLKRNISALVEKEFEIYYLSELINLDESYRKFLINLLASDVNFDSVNDKLKNIFEVFIRCSQHTETHPLLDKILNSNSMEVKKILFYHEVVYPIPYYVQLEKFRNAIVTYINSDFFKQDYEKLKEHFGSNSATLFAFPTQYSQAFDFKGFDSSFKEGISEGKIRKRVREYRLNSIRLINDDRLKIDLIKTYYYSHLPVSYKNKFLELTRKEFPNLKLDWN